MALLYLMVLVRISPWLLIGVVALAGTITALQKILEPRLRAGAHQQVSITQALNTRLIDDYQALRLLHSTGQLESADQNLQGLLHKNEAIFRGQVRRLALLEPVASFLPIVAVAVIVVLSLVLLGVQAAQVLPGLVTFVLALQRLNVRLGGIANSWNALAENSARLELTNQILESSNKNFRRMGGVPFSCLSNQIRFDSVSLRYSQNQPSALTQLNFNLPRSQTLALVGPSGAGKSSIADLLVGLYEPSEGQIFIDDQPLNTLDLPSWQQRLGVVSQDTFIQFTIAENLCFGLEGVFASNLSCAVRPRHQDSAHLMVTTLLEKGVIAYPRQRHAFWHGPCWQTRAVNSDEATSALDSERSVWARGHSVVEGQTTVLVIAHPPSTIVNAHQILVLDRGKIIQRSYQQLHLTWDVSATVAAISGGNALMPLPGGGPFAGA